MSFPVRPGTGRCLRRASIRAVVAPVSGRRRRGGPSGPEAEPARPADRCVVARGNGRRTLVRRGGSCRRVETHTALARRCRRCDPSFTTGHVRSVAGQAAGSADDRAAARRLRAPPRAAVRFDSCHGTSGFPQLGDIQIPAGVPQGSLGAEGAGRGGRKPSGVGRGRPCSVRRRIAVDSPVAEPPRLARHRQSPSDFTRSILEP